jgi:hypothetical protein
LAYLSNRQAIASAAGSPWEMLGVTPLAELAAGR